MKKMMKNDVSFECWVEENEEALICEYYESGACYDSDLESFEEYMYEKEIERRMK